MRKIIIKSSIFFLFFLLIMAKAQSLTLKESVDFAMNNSPAVLAAHKKLSAANAKLAQAVGAFLPTVKLDANYGKSYSDPSVMQVTVATSQGAVTQDFTTGTDATVTAKGWGASLTQPLFVAALWPGYNIARNIVDLAQEEYKKAQLEVAFNVTQNYFGVLKAIKYVELSKESNEMAESHLNQIKMMLAAGVSTRADQLRGEVQLANSEVGLTKAKNALELAKDAFNNSLGRDLEQPVDLKDEGFTGTFSNLPEYKEVFRLALENRPDWRIYLFNENIARESLRVSQLEYLPTLLLSAQTGNRVTEYPGYGSSTNSWSVIGAASWTIFDGLGRENRIKEAVANLEAQKEAEEQVRNGVALEVRDVYLTLKSASETIASAKKAVASAEENQKVMTSRFASGAGTNIEVLDAQVSLTQARINYLQSLFDLETAKAKLNKVIGKEVVL
ncbi:MAG: TolC family protein [Candidatus Margulisiibacteriota bacterium]